MTQSEKNQRDAAGAYPAAVVWDLDGTLTESAPDLATALNGLLAEAGLEPHPVARVRLMIGHGVAVLIERGFEAAGAPLSAEARDALVPDFMARYSACATDNTHLVPGARYALERLARAGVRQGLCTNKPEAVTRQILDALDVTRYFGAIIGGDSTTGRKPDPIPLQTCLDRLGVAPGNAVMVGDSAADVGAARAAGVYVVLVPDGYTGVPAESLGADLVVGAVAEVPSRLPSRDTGAAVA
jgi:phosphoglycolate phosphatase